MIENSTTIFKKIRRIQINAAKLADEILTGSWRSAFKGEGIEFEETREYQSGDDLRYIDWPVTARMNKPFVKIFKEERELTLFIAADISASSLFGGIGEQKREIIASLGAALAFSAIKNSDKAGLILFSEKIEKFIAPKNGVRHVIRLIRDLLTRESVGRKTDINNALSFLGGVQIRRAIIFIISDFIDNFDTHLMSVLAKKHDLIAVCVSDPYELDFPNMGLVNLCDMESGELFLADSRNEELRKDFKLRSGQRIMVLEREFKKIGASFIHITTSEPYLEPLRKFFKMRKIRH